MGEDELVHWMGKHGIHVNVVTEAIRTASPSPSPVMPPSGPRLAMPAWGIGARRSDRIDRRLRSRIQAARHRRRTRPGALLPPDGGGTGAHHADKEVRGLLQHGPRPAPGRTGPAWSQYVRPGAPKDPVLIGRAWVGGWLAGGLPGYRHHRPDGYGTLFSRFSP